MAKKRVFISFDYDYDSGAKNMLTGQAKLPESPFEFTDASVKEHLAGDWKERVRLRMKNIDVVIVLCGERTDLAAGVTAEIAIAKECGKKIVYIGAYGDKECVLPRGAGWLTTVHRWSWDNLNRLIA